MYTRNRFATFGFSLHALAACAVAACLLMPGRASGIGRILDSRAALPDFDSRSGQVVLPSAQAQSIVGSLGANVTWNAFGTPQSLIKYGGYLSTGLSGDPVTAARNWIRANKELFRLSDQGVTNLDLVNDSQPIGTTSHAVLFRQKFGSLPAAQDGMITVAIANGKVAYVSSSSAGDQAAPAAAILSATNAWLYAAANVGLSVSPITISATRTDNSWTVFDVDGFSHPQRARQVAFPTPTNGVRPAFETIVLNVQGGKATAYTHFIDAQTGAVLFRQNKVNEIAEAAQASPPTTQFFSGAYQDDPLPRVCGPCHVFTVPADTATIDVVASADVPSNDIILNLYNNGTCSGGSVGNADTATSPEAIHYIRAGDPSVTYSVQVCPFGSPTAPPVAPYSYNGALLTNSVAVQAFPFPPKWKFFKANPPLDYSSTDTRIIACWVTTGVDITKPVNDCQMVLENLAARVPWDHDVQLNFPTFTTKGNAAITAQAWTSPLTPGEGYRPVSASRDYIFPWNNLWQTNKCSQTNFTPGGNDIDASITHLFSMHNRMHDWSYFLGFTERHFNLQDNNFGLTAPGPYPLGREKDPELGDVQAGAVTGGYPSFEGRDNANQITLNDGIPPITNQYLFQPLGGAFYSPCVDGDFDMSVVGHEYTHAISNRMVGGPDANLTGAQAGAMGESWSDLDAVEYLNEYGFVPTNGENPFSVGAYATGNKIVGIRNYALNNNPLNYSDIGYDTGGAEVHSDGEIWNAVNFDIRQALITKYNATYPASNAALQLKCANGQDTPDHCPGNRRWIQIVYDAFLLMPANSSMLDARDAYLAADVMRFAGANQRELWKAFAFRGMGVSALSNTNNDGDPRPGFDSFFAADNATISFKAVAFDEPIPCGGCNDERSRKAIAAKLYVGAYEARATPILTTIPDHTTTPLASAKFVAGTYNFVAVTPGYGHFRFQRTFTAGQTATFIPWIPSNWASKNRTPAAAASGDGTNQANLIDDTEATNWGSSGALVGGQKVVVQLSGGAHTVRRVQVSALHNPTAGGRFVDLRQFEILTCTANVANANCSTFPLGFTSIFTSPADAFPGDVPRPGAPNLIIRSFNVPATNATHVAMRVVTNQCTGQVKFQGEQDNDPTFSTDCRIGDGGVILPPKNRDVFAAELQVYSNGGGVGVPGDPVVTLTMTAPATAAPGSNIDYDITYTNLGPLPSQSAKITDVLPANLSFVSATGGGTYDASTRTVTWNLGTVPVDYTGSVRLTAKVSPTALLGTLITNQADFTGQLTVSPPTAVSVTTVLP